MDSYRILKKDASTSPDPIIRITRYMVESHPFQKTAIMIISSIFLFFYYYWFGQGMAIYTFDCNGIYGCVSLSGNDSPGIGRIFAAYATPSHATIAGFDLIFSFLMVPLLLIITSILIWYGLWQLGIYVKGMGGGNLSGQWIKFVPNISAIFSAILSIAVIIGSLGYYLPNPYSAYFYFLCLIMGLALYLHLMKIIGDIVAPGETAEEIEEAFRRIPK
ncbi:MAG: hypothetical protein V1835_06020 [Candidatus Micrarchaeota archaeon]